MWLSGLRGAMAYALALKATADLDMGPVILILTLIYAFVTILGIGSILNPILSKLDVKRKDGGPNQENSNLAEEETLDLAASDPPKNCFGRFKRCMYSFDNKYLAKIFIDLN